MMEREDTELAEMKDWAGKRGRGGAMLLTLARPYMRDWLKGIKMRNVG